MCMRRRGTCEAPSERSKAMDPATPARALKKAAKKTAHAAADAADKVADLLETPARGAPGAAPPALEEPTEPTEPLGAKPDQDAPELRTATGAVPEDARSRAQQGAH